MSTSSASSDALYVVPVGKRDTVLVVIHSVNLPAKDCSVEFFNKDWRKFISPKFFQEIELNDLILPNSPQNLVTLLKEENHR